VRELQVWRLGTREYAATVALQKELVRRRRAGEIPDTLLLLEHEAVITVGRATGNVVPPAAPSLQGGGGGNGDGRGALPLPRGEGSLRSSGGGTPSGIPIVETSRGGQATYHGPGQLVAYPIVDLRQWRTDLHWYLRQLEAVGVETLRRLGVEAGNRPGHTGVWIGERKIASIGVAVRGWITYHGLALNVDCDMAGFDGFSPCGLPSDTMVSLRDLGLALTTSQVGGAFAEAFQGVFGYGRLNILPETPEALLHLRAVSTTMRGR